jgi:sugar lactone lactonase YvrE
VIHRIESSPILPFTAKHLVLKSPNPHWKIGAVSGVAAGKDGRLYVIQRGAQTAPILVVNLQGGLVDSWGKGDFSLPHSVRLDPEGNVWAVDAGTSTVIKYSRTGKKLLTLSMSPVPDTGGPFRGITDVAFASNGHVYITDGYGNARVLEYSPKGVKLKEWGRPGSGTSEFHLPHSLQISTNGTIYVADRENGRIEKFDLRGRPLGTIEQLGRCYSLALSHGALWASMSPLSQDPGSPGWVVKLDPNSGKILGHFDIPNQRQGHALSMLSSGDLVLTAGQGLILLSRR